LERKRTQKQIPKSLGPNEIRTLPWTEKASTNRTISFRKEKTLPPIQPEPISDKKEQLALKHFKHKPLKGDDQASIELTKPNPKPIDPIN
jgi:hypothetical protein